MNQDPLAIHEAGHLVIGILDGGRPEVAEFRRQQAWVRFTKRGQPRGKRLLAAGKAANDYYASAFPHKFPNGDRCAANRAKYDFADWKAEGSVRDWPSFNAQAESLQVLFHRHQTRTLLLRLAASMHGRRMLGRRELTNIILRRETSRADRVLDLIGARWKKIVLALFVVAVGVWLVTTPRPASAPRPFLTVPSETS